MKHQLGQSSGFCGQHLVKGGLGIYTMISKWRTDDNSERPVSECFIFKRMVGFKVLNTCMRPDPLLVNIQEPAVESMHDSGQTSQVKK